MIEVKDFGIDGWAAQVSKEERARWYCERLEEGEILFFARTPFALPDEDRAFLVNVQQTSGAYHKNISYRDRLLRVFTSINPSEPQARSSLGRLRRSLIRSARAVGLPLIDRSPYDRFMLRFHHYLKTNQAFQASCPKFRWEFPPNSTWLVFTDMVPHAALSGRFALEQTFPVPRDALLLPHKSPVQILEDLSGTPLTN